MTTMQLSAFTDILARPFEQALDALAQLGLTMIDLRSRIGADTVDTLQGPAAAHVKQALAQRNLKVGCVASWGVNPMNGQYDPADPAHRQAMRERTAHLADLAAELGARSVRVYSFKRPQGPITDAHRADNAEFLSELGHICAQRGRLLLVENEPPTLTATCAELADLMRRVTCPAVKINWDIVNGWRAGETPWAGGVFEQIRSHVAHIHVKGAKANADGAFATMAIPGKDDVPHGQLLRQLRQSGFDGIITIDPHYYQFAESDKLTGVEDPVLEVVCQTRTFLRQIITDLS
jgi:sugar phosphate isomerase/epimerase